MSPLFSRGKNGGVRRGQRFQNYLATFTILDTGSELISKDWLRDLKENSGESRYLFFTFLTLAHKNQAFVNLTRFDLVRFKKLLDKRGDNGNATDTAKILQAIDTLIGL